MTPVRLFEIQGMEYVENEWETSAADTHAEANVIHSPGHNPSS